MSQDDTNVKEQQEIRRWKNRRRLAWAAFIVSAIQTFSIFGILMYAGIDRVQAVSQYGALFLGMYGFCCSIIMAYIGTAAYSDVKLWKDQ